MQRDCNLVLYYTHETLRSGHSKETVLWDSSDAESEYDLASDEDCKLVFSTTGDLAIVGSDANSVKWSIEAGSKGLVRSLELQGDGNLVIYRQTGETIWDSHSDGFSVLSSKPYSGHWNSDLDGMAYHPGDPVCDPIARMHCLTPWQGSTGSLQTIFRGQALREQQSLQSPDHKSVWLILQTDGNLVLYDNGIA